MARCIIVRGTEKQPTMDKQVNLSDFIPELRSLIQFLRMPSITKDKSGDVIKFEMTTKNSLIFVQSYHKILGNP